MAHAHSGHDNPVLDAPWPAAKMELFLDSDHRAPGFSAQSCGGPNVARQIE
jgi:hypothetical protein